MIVTSSTGSLPFMEHYYLSAEVFILVAKNNGVVVTLILEF